MMVSDMFKFSKRSEDNLKGVHPDLVKVAHRALELSIIDFGIIEGLRDIDKQMDNIKNGVSWTMNSRHLTGHAIDVVAYVDGKVSWAWPPYHIIADAFFKASEECRVAVEWGGHWYGKKADGPHFQLSWKKYPIQK